MNRYGRMRLLAKRQRLTGRYLRERLAPLARKLATLDASLYLMGTVYHFCSVHRSLGRTPAMAAGLTSAFLL